MFALSVWPRRVPAMAALLGRHAPRGSWRGAFCQLVWSLQARMPMMGCWSTVVLSLVPRACCVCGDLVLCIARGCMCGVSRDRAGATACVCVSSRWARVCSSLCTASGSGSRCERRHGHAPGSARAMWEMCGCGGTQNAAGTTRPESGCTERSEARISIPHGSIDRTSQGMEAGRSKEGRSMWQAGCGEGPSRGDPSATRQFVCGVR
mmetsp:Transcript_30060/g.79843  ORF Transcript_30060/g.79843 Transcript_30060/m.79843 type:complete len:207 (+) Transcript_30060:594-1214(+)